jgi:hypothetical protein
MAERVVNQRRALLLAGCVALVAPFAGAKTLSPIDELRTSFTVAGEPVPPEIFRDMGDGDLADSGSIIVTIDVKAATGSNHYADPVKRNGAWVSQARQDPNDRRLAEEEAYRFIGVTANKLLVVVTSYSATAPASSIRCTFSLRSPDAASMTTANATSV